MIGFENFSYIYTVLYMSWSGTVGHNIHRGDTFPSLTRRGHRHRLWFVKSIAGELSVMQWKACRVVAGVLWRHGGVIVRRCRDQRSESRASQLALSRVERERRHGEDDRARFLKGNLSNETTPSLLAWTAACCVYSRSARGCVNRLRTSWRYTNVVKSRWTRSDPRRRKL